MSYYEVDKKGTFKIYDSAPDPSTFSGYSSYCAERIELQDMIDLYAEHGFRLTFEKIEPPVE